MCLAIKSSREEYGERIKDTITTANYSHLTLGKSLLVFGGWYVFGTQKWSFDLITCLHKIFQRLLENVKWVTDKIKLLSEIFLSRFIYKNFLLFPLWYANLHFNLHFTWFSYMYSLFLTCLSSSQTLLKSSIGRKVMFHMMKNL